MSNAILEQRIESLEQDAVSIGKQRYGKWVEKANHFYKEAYGHDMPAWKVKNLVYAYANMEKDFATQFGNVNVRKTITESIADSTTTPTDINKFINHAFEMVTATLPVNIMEKFTSMQTMDRRTGEVFYMDIMRGNSKGANNAAGSVYMGALTSTKTTGNTYASQDVPAEGIGTGDGSTLTFTAVLAWLPVVAGSVTLAYTVNGTAYTVTDVAGVFTDSTNLNAGTVNPANGQVSLTFKAGRAPDLDVAITASYTYNQLIAGGEIPEVTMRFTSTTLTAQRRALNIKYLFDAAIMAGKEHGIDMEQELMDQATAAFSYEIASSAAAQLLAGATTSSNMAFSKTPPSTIIPYVQHRIELLGKLYLGGLEIQKELRQVTPSFIIGGADLSGVCYGLPVNEFQPVEYPANEEPVGMKVIGKLGNRYEVIQNLDYADNAFLLGAMGSRFKTGSVFAEFIPITMMQPNWNQSLDVFRPIFNWSAFKILNANFYRKATIS